MALLLHPYPCDVHRPGLHLCLPISRCCTRFPMLTEHTLVTRSNETNSPHHRRRLRCGTTNTRSPSTPSNGAATPHSPRASTQQRSTSSLPLGGIGPLASMTYEPRPPFGRCGNDQPNASVLLLGDAMHKMHEMVRPRFHPRSCWRRSAAPWLGILESLTISCAPMKIPTSTPSTCETSAARS